MDARVMNGLRVVADLMAVSACTAPKAGGMDWVRSKTATDEEKQAVCRVMRETGASKGTALSASRGRMGEALRMDWASDADAVESSAVLFLVGVQGRKAVGINCGGCGFPTCAEMLARGPLPREGSDFPGPFCIFRIMDLSIAAGSAAKTAIEHNVDNRMMQKVGAAALKLGLLAPCDLILGLPLSATGKNIYFDRPEKLEARKLLGLVRE
jgi:uncharacterized ferredoxin-like protein